MKIYNLQFLNIAENKELRADEKYYSAIIDKGWNIFETTKEKKVRLKEILIEDYHNFSYEEGEEYFGIPTGASYIDEFGRIIDSQIVTKEDHPNRLKYSVTSDNILLSSLRFARTPALLLEKNDLAKYVFSNGFYIFKVNENWNKKFVLYLLRKKELKFLIDNNIYRGIGISSYNLSDLYKIEIAEVPRSIQDKAVSDIELIELEVAEKLKQILPFQTIIDEVFEKEFNLDYATFESLKTEKNYQTDLISFANNPDLRFSAKFHRPAGDFVMKQLTKNTTKKIKDYLAEPIVLGSSISPNDYDENGEAYYVSMATIKNWKFEENTENAKTVSDSYFLYNQTKTIKKNDLIIARSGKGTIGKVALIESNEVKGIFADFTMRIRLQNYSEQFAYYYFRSVYFQYIIEIYWKGMGNNLNIFPIVIREFPIPDISLDEQKRIVEEIQSKIHKQDRIRSEIEELQKSIFTLIDKAIK